MKASEAIKQLTWMIEIWGDREIKYQSPSFYPPGNRYYFSPETVDDIKYICIGNYNDLDLDNELNYFEFW